MVAVLADRHPEPLEDRMATAMGVLNAATAHVVDLIREALDTAAWEGEGIRSPEHWVSLQCGASGARAAALVATARGLTDLDTCASLFRNGALSEEQARLLARHVGPAHDDEVAELAPHLTVSQLRHALRTLPPKAKAKPEATAEESTPEPPVDPTTERRDEREVRFGFDDDGIWRCRIALPPDEGALAQTALERARDVEFRLRRGDTSDQNAAQGDVPTDVTWADALVRLAEAALTNLDPGTGRPGDRYQIYLHVNADAPAASYLHLGPFVEDTVRRHHTCDAPVRIVFEEQGRIVALSEKQDTVDTKTRRLVEDRDGGCRVPGCGQRRWLHIHHLIHREDGGRTTLDNLCALCPHHHRQHHAGLLEIRGDPTRPAGLSFTTPGGRTIGPAPPRPPGAPPPHAARHLGLRHEPYRHPTGERADWRWLWWS